MSGEREHDRGTDETDRGEAVLDRQTPLPAPPVAVVFLLGAPKSGSTVLGRVLGAGDGAVAVGEARNVWLAWKRDANCSCGVPVRRCPFWSPVVDGVLTDLAAAHGVRPTASEVHTWHEEGVRWRVHALLRRPRRGPAAAYVDALGLLYEHAARQANASVVIDVSKLPADGAAARATGASCRFVHLVRDPRAVVRSRVGRDDGRAGRRRIFRIATESLGWLALDGCCTALRSLAPRPHPVVCYEDVLADPATTLARVTSAVGLDPPSGLRIDGETIVLPVAHVPAGDGRRRETGLVALRPRRRAELGKRERWLITALTAPALARYGYRLRPGGAPTS